MNMTDEAGADLRGRRILVTGGTGFLGKFVTAELIRVAGADAEIVSVGSADCDLREAASVFALFEKVKPDIVIHLAAVVGGIGANAARPADFFSDNALMGIHVIHEAAARNVYKTVLIGTVCSYPADTPIPFREEHFWNGYPEKSNAPYGIAKKMLLTQAQAYQDQFGMRFIYLIPANLYGPGDNFHPSSSHVIPSIIRKCLEAMELGKDEIEIWGDGKATRDFLYVEDAAEAIVRCTVSHADSEPMNIGSGIEVSIHDLALSICGLLGYTGSIHWNTAMPSGQHRRCVDISHIASVVGFQPKTSLQDGLERTIAWYKERIEEERQWVPRAEVSLRS